MHDKIKEEFISTLSHEIRTPLTSIKGFSKTMLDNWENLNDEQKRKFIEIISQQSQRLINLVENVLNVSKIDSGKNDAVLKKVDLKTALENALNLVKINYKDFEFKINCAKNVEQVFADTQKLQQVLINLLDNAIKYSKNSKNIEININSDKNFGSISIINFGIPIEKEYFNKIFDKFFRISNYLTSQTQGSGLGLYITKTLIEQMNGKIEVKSEEDKKSTEFTISLPLFEAENIAKHALKNTK